MPHPDVVNRTPYTFETLVLADEEGVAQYVICIQAVFSIGSDGGLRMVDAQPKINLGGQWRGDPAVSSMMLEPQSAFVKLATDVVLSGHVFAARAGAREGAVGIRVGPVQKVARVFGDRRLEVRAGKSFIDRPQPFERIPIVYERAFGGWDRADEEPIEHRYDARNPVGVGFGQASPTATYRMLPNFEDPNCPIQSARDVPTPVGFGFVSPNWQPRLGYAGTFDASWNETRGPLLPKDFDRRFFNAASSGLVSPAPLRGDEPVVVIGASPQRRTEFVLPGLTPPALRIGLRGQRSVVLQSQLDTVRIDMDAREVSLLWRGHMAVRNGPHDVLAVGVHLNAESADQVVVATA